MGNRKLSFSARLLAVSAIVGLSACSSSSDSPSAAAQLASGCTINSDCTTPLVCAFSKCHSACESSRDCPTGQRCMASDRPFHVCQLPEETKCGYNSDCPFGQLCGADGQCRDQCAADRDCVEGQVCAAGSCAEPQELDGGRLLDAASEAAAQSCNYSSECPAPFVCRNNVCAAECLGDVDCAEGQTCVNSRCKSPAVEPQPEAGPPDASLDAVVDASVVPDGAPDGFGNGCQYNSDCPDPLICLGGTCAWECKATVDCPVGKACIGNRCELALLPDGAPSGYGNACNLTSDCLPNLVCSAIGQCVYECLADFDCSSTECCLPSTHRCVVNLGGTCGVADSGVVADSGAADGPTSDSGAGAGCVTDADCKSASFCAPTLACLSGVCVAIGAANPCDDHNPCTTDQCDESAKTCSHTASGPADEDNDGHYAKACGGTADDCDDHNGAVYPGHAELCDGIDNNCDGQVDEGLWNAGAVQSLAQADGGAIVGFSPNLGAPAITRYADGTFGVVAAMTGGAGVNSPQYLQGFHLGASLSPIGSMTTLASTTLYYALSMWPSAANSGTVLAAGGEYGSTGGGNQNKSLSFTSNPDFSGLVTNALVTLTTGALTGSNNFAAPAVAYNGSTFVLAWSDGHATGLGSSSIVYVAQMSTAGVVQNTHTISGNLSDVTVQTNGAQPRVILAMGTTSALVAYRLAPPGQTRFAILDTALSATKTNPPFVDLPGTDETYPTSAAHVGSSFALATRSNDGKAIRIHRIDDTTGAVLNSVAITDPNAFADNLIVSDTQLAAINGGFAFVENRGPAIGWGWAREDLVGGFALTEMASPGASSGTIAPIDARHAAIVWQDGTLKGTIMSCAP